MGLVIAFAVALAASFHGIAEPSSAEKAIAEATKVLDAAIAAEKNPEEKAKLVAAKSRLLAAEPETQNHLISMLVDSPATFDGTIVTLRLKYRGGELPLRSGGRHVFEGRDSKNKAKLVIGIEIPKSLAVPRANDGEEVIVRFRAELNGKRIQGEALQVTR